MNVNRGKQFESQIRDAFENEEGSTVVRLYDPQAGFKGVSNICDFIAYKFPQIFYVECKSCYGNTFPFANISDTQWNGLLEVADVRGVVAGYAIWFIDHDVTYFIPAKSMKTLRDAGYKSIHAKKFPETGVSFDIIPGTKRKVMFDYNAGPILNKEYNV